MLRPASTPGRITRATRSARAAEKSSSSAKESISSAGSASSSRIRSAAPVPPGSRISRVSGPSASASNFACVLLPEPSIPSSETNTGGDPSAFGGCFGAFAPAGRRVGFAYFFAFFRGLLVLVALGSRLFRHRFLGRFGRFALGAAFLHLLHRLA